MENWEKFNETPLPDKKEFYSHLNMDDVTDADYMHAKRVCKDFRIKNLGKYHSIYVQSNTLLLADIFDNFQNICFEIYELELLVSLLPYCTWISMASNLKKGTNKIRSFN